MTDIQLSPHFKLSEFENSSTARARGINNKVPEHLIPSLKTLCTEVLEPLRAIVKEPIIISSGYRCPQLNAAVGGSKTSQHMKGEACDIHLSDMKKLRQWFTYLMDGQFDQLIMERSCKPSGVTSSLDESRGAAEPGRSQRATPTSTHYWIHVSCKPDPSKNRHQVLYLTKSK